MNTTFFIESKDLSMIVKNKNKTPRTINMKKRLFGKTVIKVVFVFLFPKFKFP